MAVPATPADPRFVELVRVSTEGQAKRDTPEDQRAALDRLRKARPGRLVERIDEAVSGAKDGAAYMRRLFDLAAARAFDELRIRHVDRLTRHPDPRERAAIYGAIADAGAVIVEAVSGRVIDPKDEMGELDLTLQGWFAARERRRILERTLAAKKRKAAKGLLAQGQPPYGRTFDKMAGQWGIHRQRAAVYRRMFSLCLSGGSLAQIAEQLSREGHLTPRGRPWNDASVSRLLRDPAAWGKYTTHEHTFHIPPVVDERTFLAVQAQLKANNSLSGPKPTVFALLRKLLTCGVCDSPMYLQLGGGTPARFRYYYCSSGDPHCQVYHRQVDVDAKVIEGVRRWLDEPATLEAAAGLGASGAARRGAERDLADAKEALRRLDKREMNTARLVAQGDIQGKTGKALLAEIKAARTAVLAQQAAAQARLAAADREAGDAADLTATIQKLRRGLARATPEQWRELVEIIFRRGGVRIHTDGNIELKGRVSLGSRLPKLPGSLRRR